MALAGCSLGDDPNPPSRIVESGDSGDSPGLGFPIGATKNTTRVPGEDAAADAAGVATAVFPGTADFNRPEAVVLVDKDDWQAAVTAAVLMAKPMGAPLLVSDGGDLPSSTRDALERLGPRGSQLAKGSEVIRIGSKPPQPSGLKPARIEGGDPYERAAAIDRFSSAARGDPSRNVIVTTGEQAPFAMPAAAWAARSGDSVLLVKRDSIPAPTRKALREHEKVNIFVLGPEAAISKRVERDLGKLGKVRRIQAETPVENAIAFARYQRGSFGWGVSVPGHNLTIANSSRPLDAAAAATLGARGVFAPLLLTDRSDSLPKRLAEHVASIQPGFEDDPRDAVYNHYWILGDEKAISLDIQAQLDKVAELVPVGAGGP